MILPKGGLPSSSKLSKGFPSHLAKAQSLLPRSAVPCGVWTPGLCVQLLLLFPSYFNPLM